MTTHHDEAPLEFTGERFLPEVAGQIAFEHLHRYYFARKLVTGLDVLDVACGEGYGSDILAGAAKSVIGVDIALDAVQHAASRYGRDTLRFVEASAAALPFADAQFDAVVSFETIEHHDQHEEMLSEIRRVLKPGGLLIISSPNKQHYSIEPGYQNPYHVKELFREEFVSLVGRYFSHLALFGQRVVHGSVLARVEEHAGGLSSQRLDKGAMEEQDGLARPLYDLLVASNEDLPALASSLFEVTVHGMDPAGFYGVHLPERVNEADRRIAMLESTQAPGADTQMHEKLDRLLQTREVELRLSADLDDTLRRLSRVSERLEALSTSHADLESAVRGLESQLQVSNSHLEEDEAELLALRQALQDSDNRVRALHDSFSWRSTAWLRIVSKLLGGGGR